MNWKELLGEDFGEKLLDSMRELATGLGIAAEHIYIVLVRQQIFYGIALMIGCVIGLTISLLLLRWIWRNPDKLDDEGTVQVFGTIFCVAATVLCTFFFFNGFMHCFNPEYYAIKEIMNTISGSNSNN